MKIIAHRGASFYAPENTWAAFNLAITQQVDGIEMDVHLTKDKKIVVLHDLNTDRTGSESHIIEDSPYEVLKDIDVGSWYGTEFNTEKIPLLEEVLNKIPQNLELYIEIKSDLKIIDPLLELIHKYPEQKNRLVLFSFNLEVVSTLKKYLPDHTLLWIVEYGYNHALSKNMYQETITKVEKAHLDGLSTLADLRHCQNLAPEIIKRQWIFNVWTVDNPALARKLKELGVTSLSTNRPDWIIKALKS